MKHTASHRRHHREIGRIQELFPAPCRRGESLPEAFYTTMIASGMRCEYSTLDYGSIAVARWGRCGWERGSMFLSHWEEMRMGREKSTRHRPFKKNTPPPNAHLHASERLTCNHSASGKCSHWSRSPPRLKLRLMLKG
jgi:hypothetical protein